MNHLSKNKIIATLSVSLSLAAAHFGMAQEALPQNELASVSTKPCALSEENNSSEVDSLHLGELLYEAVDYNDINEAKRLISEGADLNVQVIGKSPLHLAIEKDELEMSRLLIEHGADVNAEDDLGSAPLHGANYSDNVDLAKFLIEHGANVNAEDDLGSTPLHGASYSGNVDLAKLLIEHGANVSAENESGSTPLHGASYSGNVDLAKLFIEHGANVNAAAKSGDTPLHSASRSGSVKTAYLLIEHGANVNAVVKSGSTPLHEACCKGRLEVAKLLIRQGANVNAENEDGATPLYNAALSTQLPFKFKLVVLLIDCGADVNAISRNGNTLLSRVIKMGGRPRVEHLLIASGADMYAVNEECDMPIDMLNARASQRRLENETSGNKKENSNVSGYLDSLIDSLKIRFFGDPDLEPVCKSSFENDKYLDWNKLSYFERKVKGVSSGSTMLDENGAIWYVKHPKDNFYYAKEYLSGKLLQLIKSTHTPGNHFSEVKLVKNHESMALASKIIPRFKGFVDYSELEDPAGAELVSLAMFLIQHNDGHANNVGFVLNEKSKPEMALIDYDKSFARATPRYQPEEKIEEDQGESNSEETLSFLYRTFMSVLEVELNGEALQDAAAVIAGISRDDIIQTFEDCHKDVLEMGVSISPEKINKWRDSFLMRYDIVCTMAEEMDYFTLVKN